MRPSRWTSLALAAIVATVLVTPVRAQNVEIKPAAKVKRDKYVILPDEIAEKPDLINAYDVVKVLRGQWLRITRGSGGGLGSGSMPATAGYKPPAKCDQGTCPEASGSSGTPVPTEHGTPYADNTSTVSTPGAAGPVLYINEVKQEELSELRNIRVADIAEIRYLTGNIAAGRYGAGHENGAIMLKTVMYNKP
ncbi:MAG TPA: hypothetical protein VGP87_09005 [Gemmatimonadales bacterium]|jgi:hypothetical protein|nr:hypothetical protein [Gemmatimonadales bacterium]